MSTLLVIVAAVKRSRRRTRLQILPGIRLSEFRARPTLGNIKQGSSLELRRPDGSTMRTSVVDFSVEVFEGGDEDCPAFGKNEVDLFVPAKLSTWDVPVGTEIWLLDD